MLSCIKGLVLNLLHLLLQTLILAYSLLIPLTFRSFYRVFTEDNSEIEPLVNECRLDVLQSLIDFIELLDFRLVKELVNEVGNRKHFMLTVSRLSFFLDCVELFSNYIKKELQQLSSNFDVCFLESFNKFFLVDITIS